MILFYLSVNIHLTSFYSQNVFYTPECYSFIPDLLLAFKFIFNQRKLTVIVLNDH